MVANGATVVARQAWCDGCSMIGGGGSRKVYGCCDVCVKRTGAGTNVGCFYVGK